MNMAFGIFAPCLTRWVLGTYVPAPIHVFTVCGNSMTQLFSRLVASHFPHPPAPLWRFQGQERARAEIHVLGSRVAVAKKSQRAKRSFYSGCCQTTVFYQDQIF